MSSAVKGECFCLFSAPRTFVSASLRVGAGGGQREFKVMHGCLQMCSVSLDM